PDADRHAMRPSGPAQATAPWSDGRDGTAPRRVAREDAGMPVVVLEAVRTPLGAVHGALAAVHPVELLAATLRELAARAPSLWDLADAGPDAPRGATTGADVVVGC